MTTFYHARPISEVAHRMQFLAQSSWSSSRVRSVAQMVEHWTPVVAARVRDAPELDIYETPEGDGLRSVAAAAASRSQWAGRTVSGCVDTLNFASKFCRLPGISRSGGRGQGLCTKPRLLWPLTPSVHPGLTLGLEPKEDLNFRGHQLKFCKQSALFNR